MTMKKTLLIFISIFLVSLSAFSARLDLPLDNLGSGWESTYDAATKTITFDGAWKGRGWWLGSADYSAYDKVIVKFQAAPATVKLVVQYSDDSNSPDVYTNAGGTSIEVPLDAAKKNNVKQIYLQLAEAGKLVLTEAYVLGEAVVVPSAVIDFEDKEIGTKYASVGWNPDNNTSIVAANPSGTGKSLHFVGAGYNSYPKFSVNLPDGKTVGDIEKIKFDIYFNPLTDPGEYPQNRYKKIDYFIGAQGASFTANAPTGTTTDNIIVDEANSKWISKEFSIASTIAADKKALNQFDIAFGINDSKIDFYLDNIAFILTTTGLDDQDASKIFFHKNMLHLNNTGSVQIFDMNGRLVFVKQNVETVDLSSIERGVYIAKALVDGKTEIIKFVK